MRSAREKRVRAEAAVPSSTSAVLCWQVSPSHLAILSPSKSSLTFHSGTAGATLSPLPSHPRTSLPRSHSGRTRRRSQPDSRHQAPPPASRLPCPALQSSLRVMPVRRAPRVKSRTRLLSLSCKASSFSSLRGVRPVYAALLEWREEGLCEGECVDFPASKEGGRGCVLPLLLPPPQPVLTTAPPEQHRHLAL